MKRKHPAVQEMDLTEFRGLEKEKHFQAHVIAAAEYNGWRVYHAHDSRRDVGDGVMVGDKQAAGFPDLVMVHPRRCRMLFVELKRDSKRLEPEQWVWHDAIILAGGDCRIWQPQDWPEVRAELAR